MNRPISLHLNEHCLRKEGDSNPRYEYSHGSLANCWFQPLTHPSFRWLVSVLPSIVLKCGAKVWTFSDIAKFFSLFFDFMIEFWQYKESTSCNIPNNTCKTPALVLRSSIFPLGLLLILAWSYPVQPACNRSANSLPLSCDALACRAWVASTRSWPAAWPHTCAFPWWGSSCCALPYVRSIWAPWRKNCISETSD